jgi:RNA polymerase sigma factor (sigma-70 family)
MTAQRSRNLWPRLRALVCRSCSQGTDRDLLERFVTQRDEDAFAEVVRRHGPMLVRVCRRVLHDEHGAEDVAQAAFLLLAQKAASIRWRDSVAGWLYQTAFRLALKARVASGRRARREAAARPAPPPDPLAVLTVAELQAVLDEELNRLPEKYRSPIILCCLEGRSRDEAARCLGWPLAAVKDRLEQGRERLRARLARRGVLLGTALTSAWLLEGGASAALSPQGTTAAAMLVATGQATVANLLPPRLAALVKGVTTTMLLCRVTIVALVGIALTLGVAAGVTKHSTHQAPPAPAQAAQVKPAPAAPAAVQPEAVPLVGHTGAVHAVAFAAGGKAIATAGADGTVRIWDASTGTQLHKLAQPGTPVALAFSPDGRTLAALSTGQGGAAVLWDTGTGKMVWRNVERAAGSHGAIAFSGDGRRVATALGGSTTMIDAGTGKLFFLFRFAGGKRSALAFSPDGKLLVSGSGTNIYQMDAAVGRLTKRWRGRGDIRSLTFLPTGTRVAVVDGGKGVRLTDINNGQEQTSYEGKASIRALALSPDGKRAATTLAHCYRHKWQ